MLVSWQSSPAGRGVRGWEDSRRGAGRQERQDRKGGNNTSRVATHHLSEDPYSWNIVRESSTVSGS